MIVFLQRNVSCLQDEGNDGLPPPGIVLELLDVIPVLAQGPHGHLVEAGQGEEQRGKTLRHGTERQPRSHLIGVVRAGHARKETSEGVGGGVGDAANRGAGGAEVAEGDVDGEVARLKQQEKRSTHVDLSVGGGGEEGVVDVVGEVGGEQPVVGAVLEQVEDRHGVVGEAVHKDGFEEAFQVVEGVTGHCEIGTHGVGFVRCSGAVEEPGPGVDVRVDEEGPSILGQEHRGPADLRAQILDVDGAVRFDVQRGEGVGVLSSFGFLQRANFLSVRVQAPLLLANRFLDVPDCTAVGQPINCSHMLPSPSIQHFKTHLLLIL